MSRYVVVGASGHAQEVAWTVREQARAEGKRCDLLFVDDRVPRGPLASGLGEVIGPLDAVADYVANATLVLAVGLPEPKRNVVARLAPLHPTWATVVHPSATIGPNVELGEGSYIAAGAILTVNVRVGRFVTVNAHCLVAHEDVIGDFATLHPDVHLAGDVTIGEGCELGSGSVVIQHLRIGDWAVLGAGTVAVRPLAGRATYVGVPARPLAAAPSRAVQST
jgi:sugar O-acyltransferase (sialic acid O-acetyltransferase NeuD family)